MKNLKFEVFLRKEIPCKRDFLLFDFALRNARIFILIFFVSACLISCETSDRKDASSIAFTTKPVQSQSLLVVPTLKCFPSQQGLELNLTLKNLLAEKITITEIALQNSKGLKSVDERIAGNTICVSKNADTTIVQMFQPVNDKQLFQTTGLPGLIDSAYQISVFYSVEGKEGIRVVNLASRMATKTFLLYRELYDVPVHAYHFNMNDGFADKQKRFLQASLIASAPPFVHVTEQEIAISGLNLRMKCYHRKDSLQAEIFMVNHSDMTIRIDTSKMDLIIDAPNENQRCRLSIEKVTGSKTEPAILRKGERTMIRMRKYVHDDPKRILFTVSESFFLPTDKLLFSDDLELVPKK